MPIADNDKNLRLAVLIDADNAPRDCLQGIMEEVAIYGTPNLKKAYGDWSTRNLAGWKQALLDNSVTPMQQFAYTKGKNSTDSAMIIDAMDLLYNNHCDGFVLVSSDSDFTRLAIRLREAGKLVIGMGERKTPAPFIVACDKFIYIEVIRAHQAQDEEEPEAKSAPKPARRVSSEAAINAQGVPQAVVDMIADSLSMIADEDGYAFMGELGNLLLRKQPDFDPRNYGFQKLTQLVKSLDRFEIDVRPTSNPHTKHVYLRDRESQS